jgi:predicted enzyme involved in methoxymalonyl-ACP biosynthesis
MVEKLLTENIRWFDYFTLGLLIVISITLIYAIIYIHDIPYEIAKKRNHPHQDAIHTAGWVSLFLLHTIWPFLWIWATLYKPEKGWGVGTDLEESNMNNNNSTLESLKEEISSLKSKIQELEYEITSSKKEEV